MCVMEAQVCFDNSHKFICIVVIRQQHGIDLKDVFDHTHMSS